MTNKKEMAIVVSGNLSDGFTFTGPFKDFDEACEWADGEPETWVATLYPPTDDWIGEDER